MTPICTLLTGATRSTLMQVQPTSKRSSRRSLSLGLIALASIAGSWGCGHQESGSTAGTRVTSDRVTISAAMEQKVGRATAHNEPGTTELRMTGRVEFDPDRVTHVSSLVNGTCTRILVKQGDEVRKGQVLAEVYSADLAQAISDVRKAEAQATLAERALRRTKELAEAKIASQRDLQQVESDRAQAEAEQQRARHALAVLGGSAQGADASATYRITAPIAGTVLERFAQPGAMIRNDGVQPAFTIGSTSALWVTLDAYPDQLRSLIVGDSVSLRAAGLEDHVIAARIDNISPVVDQNSFTTKVRLVIPNAQLELRPSMFVTATVYHRGSPGLYVPTGAAFVDSDGKTYLFRADGLRSYRKTMITTGRSGAGAIEVTSGCAAGDTVAASALFLNEEMRSAQN